MLPRFQRCLRCFRPHSLCFCDAIGRVNHRTSVVILQHRRERFHPFNTARIVSESLQRCELLVGHNGDLATRFADLELHDHVGLLYPGVQAQLLSELPRDQRPSQLVVLDGTWHQTKTLYRDIPRLHELPQYRLAPSAPGRYRIRREPNAHALSTLEATVSALTCLEPDNTELAGLTDTFDRMIGDQLGKTSTNWRQNQRRRRGSPNIPRALTGDLANIVVAYGERAFEGAIPMYWTAIRLGTGERFACAIESNAFDDTRLMAHLRLDAHVAETAVSLDEFRNRWRAFVRPDDRVAVQHHGTATLLRNAHADFVTPVILKAVNAPASIKPIGQTNPTMTMSRASERLQTAVEYVYRLNRMYQNRAEPTATLE